MTPKLYPVTCERARGQLSARADGELSELENAELGRHLATCASCRVYEGELAALSRVLRMAELEEPGFPIFVPRRRRVTLARVQVAAAAAAMLAIVAVASLAGGLGGPELTSSVGFVDASQSARPAYLDSPSYEQRLIRAVRDAHRAHNRPHMGSAVAN